MSERLRTTAVCDLADAGRALAVQAPDTPWFADRDTLLLNSACYATAGGVERVVFLARAFSAYRLRDPRVGGISTDAEGTRDVSTVAPRRRYVKLAEAAEYLQVTDRTIRQMIADGRLTGYRSGTRLVRVDLNELDDAMQPFGGAA